MKINNRTIENGQKPYIIAEIGINHNGDLALAKMMIDIAKDCNCDAVKFQKRTIDIVYSKDELEKERKSVFGTTNGDLKRGLEFSESEYNELFEYAKNKNIDIFASPWDIQSLTLLEKFSPCCYKIASACLTDIELLKEVKKTGKPILISVGMSNEEELDNAIGVLGHENICILSCTSTYPTEISDMNLNRIKTLMNKYPNIPIGYSGHENGILPTLIAVSMGAAVIERHITISRQIWGSDQKASLEPLELKDLVSKINDVILMMGDGKIKMCDNEAPIKDKLRRY